MGREHTSRRPSRLQRFFALVPGLGLAGALGWLAATAGPAAAQDATNAVARTYLNKPLVHLPIEIDNSYRSQISSLVLYMKEGPQGAWSLRDKGNALQTSFTFRAQRDGEFWFRIVAVDTQGKAHPDDLNKDPHEAVVVVVDSVSPTIELSYQGTGPEGQIVQCELRNANPDPLKVRFFYQTRDSIWRSLEPVPNRPDLFCIPGQAAITNLVKVMATDLAGNSSQRTFNLGELATAHAARAGKTAPTAMMPPAVPQLTSAPAQLPMAVAQNAQLPLVPPAAPTLPTPQPAPQPAPQVAMPQATPPNLVREPEIALPDLPRETIVQVPSGKELPFQPQEVNPPVRHTKPAATAVVPPAAPTPGPSLEGTPDVRTVSAGTLSHQATPPNLQFVNTPQVFLNYSFENVGASGVGKVEIWATRDRCQTWTKIAEDAQRKSPAEVQLPGEGMYGLKMVVSNGRGFGAQPPQPGDPADWWIEVDTSKPKANLSGIRNGTAQEGGAVYVLWQADDKNLAPEPIELFFASTREGPWTLITRGLRNDGQYRWTPPVQAGPQTYLRLLARDKAGNVTLSETLQPVPLDDQSRPRVRLLNVTTTPAGGPQSSSSNGPIVSVATTSTPVGEIQQTSHTAP